MGVEPLSALIAQVEADVTRLEYEWDDEIGFRVAEAAPVLAAALKDAVETLERIADPAQEVERWKAACRREAPPTAALPYALARSFLERHKEEAQ